MVLIPFGIVKIRKGYGLRKGPGIFFFLLLFLLVTKANLPSSLVSLDCHLQPFETVSDYPCGN